MKLIASADNNWAIGFKDSLLVRIPADMKNFRNLTMGKVIVYGRKTLAGFPNGMPLAGRTNVILSSRPDFEAKGAIIAHDLDELFAVLDEYDSNDICIIGGGSIYKQLEPYCDSAIITRIDYSYQADTYFPNLDAMENWKIVDTSEEQTCFDIIYHFVEYKNTTPLIFSSF